jgi:hypothetical protein
MSLSHVYHPFETVVPFIVSETELGFMEKPVENISGSTTKSVVEVNL